MEIKTSELTGRALDWAVARAIGFEDIVIDCDFIVVVHERHELPGLIKDEVWSPSTDWIQGGPLIGEYRITIEQSSGDIYACLPENPLNGEFGSTALIASCRAIVSAKLGDTVSVPNELEG